MSLKSKVAVVTGSTSGIGLAIARALAAEGADVVINGFGKPEEIEAARSGIERDFGVRCAHSPADMTKPAEIAGMIAKAQADFGSVDILVNNAGIQFVSPVEEFPPEKWDQIIAINLSSAFHAMRAAVPGMKAKGWGRIISTASAHSKVASPFKSRLRGGQARHRRALEDRGARGRPRRRHRELHLAGLCLDAPGGEPDPRHHEGPRPHARPGDQRRPARGPAHQAVRQAGRRGRPGGLPAAPTPPPRSPAPTSPSTAAGPRSRPGPLALQASRQAKGRAYNPSGSTSRRRAPGTGRRCRRSARPGPATRREQGLLVEFLGQEDVDPRHLARGQLLAGDVQGRLGGGLRPHGGGEGPAVGLDRLQRVGDVLKGREDGAAVLRAGLFEQRLGLALLVQQLAALEDRLGDHARRQPEGVGTGEAGWRRRWRRRRPEPPRVMFGSRLAIATPTWALAACRLASAARTSGRWSTSFEGRLTGSWAGKVRLARRIGASWSSDGRAPGQVGELVALGRQLLLQRRQGLLGLGQGGLLCRHVDAGDLAELLLGAQDLQHVRGEGDDPLVRRHLLAQRRLLDRSGDDVGGEGEEHRFALEPLAVLLGLHALDLAAQAAEHVGRVGDVQGDGVEGEQVVGRRQRRRQGSARLLAGVRCSWRRPSAGGFRAGRARPRARPCSAALAASRSGLAFSARWTSSSTCGDPNRVHHWPAKSAPWAKDWLAPPGYRGGER